MALQVLCDISFCPPDLLFVLFLSRTSAEQVCNSHHGSGEIDGVESWGWLDSPGAGV